MKNKNEKTEADTEQPVEVDQSKRRLSKAGLVAPVLMTLASKPVFAVQGLSNMISGTGSGVVQGACKNDDYYGGLSHGFWKTDGGDTGSNNGVPVNVLSWEDAWSAINLTYGTRVSSSGTQEDRFNNIGASTVDDAFGKAFGQGVTSGFSGLTIKDALWSRGGMDKQIICGVLNILLIEHYNGEYFLSKEQFLSLYKGENKWTIPTHYQGEEGISTLSSLISTSTIMHGIPGDCAAEL